MEGTKCTEMKEQEENDFEKRWTTNIRVFDDSHFRWSDDDPFLQRKLEAAVQSLKECPLPDFLIDRMKKED